MYIVIEILKDTEKQEKKDTKKIQIKFLIVSFWLLCYPSS